jgi:hypothetical protein
MYPLHEREILNVPLLANGNEPNWYQKWVTIFRFGMAILLRILAA